jgi:chaperonin GroES
MSKPVPKKICPVVPVGKRIVVLPEALEEKTKSGIIIPDTAKKEKPARGTVVAVGEKLDGVSVGDTVVFSKYAAEEVHVDEDTYLVIKHEDVVAVVQ